MVPIEPTGWLSMLHLTKDDIMSLVETLVMGVLGLIVLLLVVRPLVRRIITPDERALAPSGAGARALRRRRPLSRRQGRSTQ